MTDHTLRLPPKLIPIFEGRADVNVTGEAQQTVMHRFVLAPLEPDERIIEHDSMRLLNDK